MLIANHSSIDEVCLLFSACVNFTKIIPKLHTFKHFVDRDSMLIELQELDLMGFKAIAVFAVFSRCESFWMDSMYKQTFFGLKTVY